MTSPILARVNSVFMLGRGSGKGHSISIDIKELIMLFSQACILPRSMPIDILVYIFILPEIDVY